MSQQWFELVSPNHFWIARRLEVLKRLAGSAFHPELAYAEIGCGNGILQCQLEQQLGLAVDGFDLGLTALESNQATSGQLYYYNILDRNPDFRAKYDVIFLCDVLEHIESESEFLQGCLFHLKSGGKLIVNVPSRMELYSNYDKAVGHVRRYCLADFTRLAQANGLILQKSTYWGFPFYFLLVVRKFLLAGQKDEATIVKRGMKPPTSLANLLFKLLSRLEFIPQRALGTSIMVVLEKP